MCRGNAALESAQSVLQQPELEGLQLYSFRAAAKRDRLYIRLDKVHVQIHLLLRHCISRDLWSPFYASFQGLLAYAPSKEQ